MSDDSDLLDAIDVWGDALCAWCCNISVERMDEMREVTAIVPDEIVVAIKRLAVAARELPGRENEPRALRAAALAAGRMATVKDPSGHTVLNAIRGLAGGELSTRGSADPLMRALRWLAIDLFPAYLLLQARAGGPELEPELLDMGRYALFEPAVREHPAYAAFEAAFRASPRVATLRSVMDEPRILLAGLDPVSGSAYLESDALPAGHMLRPRDLALELVEAAWDRHLLTGEADPAVALGQLAIVLGELVDALGGATIEVPVTVGLRGLHLETSRPICVRGGTVRSPTLNEWNRSGEDDPVGLVLQLRLKTTIAAGLEPAPGRWSFGWQDNPWAYLSSRADEVALAVALAASDEYPPAVSVAWATICAPVGEAELLRRSPERATEPVEVDRTEATSLGNWISRIRSHSGRLPPVALHRSLLALHGRRDPADGLVDAVVALESLLGGGASLRLQAACAWLLAPDDYSDRQSRYEEIGKLYDLRSAVVHKGRSVTVAEWMHSIGILREVLRRLLTQRSDLLEGKDRGTRLLLGEPAADTGVE